jgi:hypothetical protein
MVWVPRSCVQVACSLHRRGAAACTAAEHRRSLLRKACLCSALDEILFVQCEMPCITWQVAPSPAVLCHSAAVYACNTPAADAADQALGDHQ